MEKVLDDIKIEFFHDVICSFCFPMSYRMRLLKEQHPEVEIVHRSYALTPQPEDFARMFGTREDAKEEILSHWDHANQNDDLHRFNIAGMKAKDFPFPYSMPGLWAAKAARFIGGEAMYWDIFDALQKALFVENRNIEDEQVLESIVREQGVDVDAWRKLYESPEVRNAVEVDLQLAANYGIRSVPSLIVNGRYNISGAQPLDTLIADLEKIQEQLEVELQSDGASCEVDDKGNWGCD